MICKHIKYGFLLLSILTAFPGVALADMDAATKAKQPATMIDLSAGYRWVDTERNPNRAAEFSFLDESPTFHLTFQEYKAGRSVSMEGDYLNKNDYSLYGDFNYKALLRLNAKTERFYHNLDHYPYQDSPEAPLPDPGAITYQDDNVGSNYGKKITINEVKLRSKLSNYPAHINLTYWRMEKKGKEQQRFLDESCTGCHMRSKSKSVDHVTEEITGGVDAHIGPVDVAFLQTLREFRVKNSEPPSSFGGLAAGPSILRPADDYVHDTTPESRLSESTFLINLPPSGGFVTSARYTFGKRENESELAAVSPVDAETEYQKLAADVTYTPYEKWTLNFRYRMLELDSDVPATQTSDGVVAAFGGQVPVRDSIDIDRNSYAAFISYRPSNRLTVKGEFEREETERSPTGVGQHSTFAGISNTVWGVPEREEENRARLSFFSRFFEKSALRLNGWYEYRDVDDPAYSTTLNSSNEVFISANYKPATLWGITGNIDILRGENDDHHAIQFDGSSPIAYGLNREEDRENLTLGIWAIPGENLSADFNYGFLHMKVDQDVLFGSSPDFTIRDNKADYEQEVHTLSLGVNMRFLETLNCRLEGYHVRSHSEFSPGFSSSLFDYAGGTSLGTSDNLSELSEVDLRQNGARAHLSWKLTEQLTAGIEYTFDDYDDQNSDSFDGEAQSITMSLAGVF